jgi:hypothetical protein
VHFSLCITRWLHGDVWWDPFQFCFSGQTGFYNGNFSPQEQVLAWTNATTKLTTTEAPGIQEAGLQWICFKRQICRVSIPFDYFILHKYSHKFSPSLADTIHCLTAPLVDAGSPQLQFSPQQHLQLG